MNQSIVVYTPAENFFYNEGGAAFIGVFFVATMFFLFLGFLILKIGKFNNSTIANLIVGLCCVAGLLVAFNVVKI